MAKRSIVPFGPQHPVLPEPVHLDLVLEDETVVRCCAKYRLYSQRAGKTCRKKGF